MTGAVVGVSRCCSALVLGLLIWTAYGVSWTKKAAVQTLAITDLKFDEALQEVARAGCCGGPHEVLREGITTTIAEIWGDSDGDEEGRDP